MIGTIGRMIGAIGLAGMWIEYPPRSASEEGEVGTTKLSSNRISSTARDGVKDAIGLEIDEGRGAGSIGFVIGAASGTKGEERGMSAEY